MSDFKGKHSVYRSSVILTKQQSSTFQIGIGDACIENIALSLQKTLRVWIAVQKVTEPVFSRREAEVAINMQIFRVKKSELAALLTEVQTIKLQCVASDCHKQQYEMIDCSPAMVLRSKVELSCDVLEFEINFQR